MTRTAIKLTPLFGVTSKNMHCEDATILIRALIKNTTFKLARFFVKHFISLVVSAKQEVVITVLKLLE